MDASRYERTLFAGMAAAALLVLAAEPVAAQQTGRVAGTVVVANTERPVAGAQVFVPGVGVGSLTNSDGEFLLLNVPAGERTVRVRMVGYGTSERIVNVPAGGSITADFRLRQEAIALDEIVVTGAGQATERKRLGNTIATIDATQLENAPVATISDLLQGREPGIAVGQSGGIAGEGSQIRIRGSASLSQSNEPIIYVDGVRIDSDDGFGGAGSTSRLDDINPESIDRIEVLKGAAAATLYGTEASNGVIQIFTKTGSDGAARWRFEVEQGFSQQDESRYEPLHGYIIPEADAEEYGVIGLRNGLIPGTAEHVENFWGFRPEPYEVFEADIMPLLFERGYQQAYNLSVSGGSDLMTYYASGRISAVDGTYGGEDYGPARDVDEQRQGTANVTIFPVENLRLRLNSQYMDRHHGIPTNGNSIFGGFSLSMMSKPELATEANPTGAFAFTAWPEMMQIIQTEDTERFTGSMTASYTPAPSMTVDATFGLDMVNLQGIYYRPFGWNVSGISNSNPQGDRFVQDRNHRHLTFDLKGAWDTDLTADFSSSLVLGSQVLLSRAHNVSVDGEQFPAPGLEVAGAASDQSVGEFIRETAQTGFFAQEQVGFRDYFFLTGGLRYDKHSAFGETAGAALYPKVSASLVASDMPGWSGGTISTLRIRGAVGQSGLQPGAFDKFTTFEPLPAESGPGVEPDNLGNPDLEPEVSTEWEAGAELGLFNNRVALEGTYWNRTVTNVLVDRQFAPSGGFLSPQLDNLGEMKAWGVELGTNGSLYEGENVSVNLYANTSFLREEVTDMGGAPPLKIGYYRYRNWIREGHAPGAFFGPKLQDAPCPFDLDGDGAADSCDSVRSFLSEPRLPDQLPLALADEDGDGDLLDHYLGKPTPDWQGSFGADITFLGNFSLNAMFEYKAGEYYVHDLLGAFRRTHIILGRNTRETAELEAAMLNPASSPDERLEAAQTWANVGASLQPYNALNAIKPANFLRWRELSLTYRVPRTLATRLGARSLVLNFGARNVKLWTKYTGIDPENNVVTRSNFLQGVDGWRPGIPRSITFSARVGF